MHARNRERPSGSRQNLSRDPDTVLSDRQDHEIAEMPQKKLAQLDERGVCVPATKE